MKRLPSHAVPADVTRRARAELVGGRVLHARVLLRCAGLAQSRFERGRAVPDHKFRRERPLRPVPAAYFACPYSEIRPCTCLNKYCEYARTRCSVAKQFREGNPC